MYSWLERRFDLIFALGVFVIAAVVFSKTQPQMSFNDGLEWDGRYYAKVTQDFSNGVRPTTYPPFVFRIGIPYLASRVGSDVIHSWRTLGLLASVPTLLLLYVLLCRHIEKRWVRLVLLLFFLLNFKSAIRAIWSAPVETDYFDKLFLISGLIVVDRIKERGWTLPLSLLLSSIVFTGVLCREIVAVVAVAALFAGNPIGFESGRLRLRFPPVLSFLPLLGAMAAMGLVRTLVTPLAGKGFGVTAIEWLYEKGLPDYLLAWFIAFSPALILPLYDWRNTLRFLRNNQHLFAYLGLFSVLGWIGGSATFRLLYWGVPVVLILVGLSLQNLAGVLKGNWTFITLCTAAILVDQRVFWPIPDAPGGESRPWVFMTPLCSNPEFIDAVGMGSLRVRFLATASYFAVAAVLLLILSNRSGKRLQEP